MKHVAFAVLLLAVLALAGCGAEKHEAPPQGASPEAAAAREPMKESTARPVDGAAASEPSELQDPVAPDEGEAPMKPGEEEDPATPSGGSPPTPAAEEKDAETENEDGAFSPPDDWCGTGRMGPRRTMGAWSEPDPDGRYKRKFVQREGTSWVLVTEWGEDREGHFETWQEKSALPDAKEIEANPSHVRAWMDELHNPDEERVFVAALALGTHEVRKALEPLASVLWYHGGYHARLAAAISLGRMKDTDAVFVLLERRPDQHPLVWAAILEALHLITGHEIAPPKAVPEDIPAEYRQEWINRRLNEEWKHWWEKNRETVRERLGRKR